MKKTILLASLFAASAAFADQVSLTPMQSSDNWTIGKDNPDKTVLPVLNTGDNNITYSDGSWSRGYSIYALSSPITLTSPEDTLTVTFTIQTSDLNSLLTGTLTGGSTSLCMGLGAYNNYSGQLQSGTTKTTTDGFYNMQASTTGGTYVEPANTTANGVLSVNTPLTLTTTISWVDNQFKATITYGESGNLGTYELGQTYTLNKIILSTDGNSTQTISNLTVTGSYTTPAVPEPATATLSLLALAGLCARRRRK